mmetsp:Transcript_84803/g.134271  ORF Transcript_84803/g.134271 Transcript_84803/m.134271 type:complete len:222 (+) Transcript_84803:376-1041(+)
MRLWRYMTNDEAMGSAREATIRHQSHIFPQASTHDSARWSQHLPHPRTTLWALIADDNKISLGNLPLFQALQHGFFAVKDIGSSREGRALLASDLANSSLVAQIASQNLQVASLLDAPFQGQNHTLRTEVQVRNTHQVLCNGLASDRHTVAVEPAKFQQVFHHCWDATNTMHVLHSKLSAGLQIRNQGRLVADPLEVIDAQLDLCCSCNGKQMQHCVGGTA